MKIFLIVLLTIYIVIFLLVLFIQIFVSAFFDQDRDAIPWKLVLKQSFLWPWMLIKFIIGVNK